VHTLKKSVILKNLFPSLFIVGQLILVGLKLTGLIYWGWPAVLAPTLLILFLCGALLFLYVMARLKETKAGGAIVKIIMSVSVGYLAGNFVTYAHTGREPLFTQLYEAIRYSGLDVPPTMYAAYGLFALGIVFPIVLMLNKGGSHKYGYAKIATKSDIANPRKIGLYANDGVILGKAYGKVLRLAESLSILVAAPPGTGKTSGVILPNLLLNKTNSLIIHDPKGELLKTTSVYRKGFSKISVFDPVSDHSSSFNALDNALLVFDENGIPNLSASRKHIENVTTIIMPVPEGTSDAYWIKAARSIFIFLALWLLWRDHKVSIPAVRDLLLSQGDAAKLFETLMRGEDPRGADLEINAQQNADDKLRYAELMKMAETSKRALPISEIEEMDRLKKKLYGGSSNGRVVPQIIKTEGNGVMAGAKNEKQLAGVLGTAIEQLSVFADEAVAKNTREGCDFTSDKLRKEVTTLYVVVRDEDAERLKTLTALLFEVLANQLSSKMPGADDCNVTFFLDEFVRLGKLQAVKKLPDIARGYRANVVFIAQELAQITTVYGQQAADVFESTCSIKIIFRQNNQKAAKRISESIGNKTVERVSQSADKSKAVTGGRKSESVSEEGIPLFSAQDVMNLDKDKCLVLVQGHYARPIYADVFYWFKDKQLKKIVSRDGYTPETDFETVYQALDL